MNHTRIIIPGKPIAKKRPRFFRRGSFVGTYNPQETEEGRWLLSARTQLPKEILHGPIALKCLFVFEFPKSFSKKKMAEASHITKPDLDNLVKFIKDCLNGEAWRDDSQVVSLVAKKLYDREGKGAHTEIILVHED
jgi:Holliday junction resolvase RusA-like endonuclease